LVSVIVPVYNVEKYLKYCIESLLAQDYEDLEIILVDDGSTDSSADICDEYAHRYANVHAFHKENGGLSDARNFGMKHAFGKWITFVDSDDTLCPNYVSTMVKFAEENTLDIAVCDFYQTSEDELGRTHQKKSSDREYFWEKHNGTKVLLYQKKFTTSACAKLYKRSLFSSVQFPVGKLHEDVGTIYKVFEMAQKIGYIDKRMYCYLQRNHSITHTVFSIRKMDYIFLTLEMIDYFKNNNPELIKAAISRHFSACFQVLLMCPLEEVWEKEYNFLIEEIKKYAPTVMRDRNARVRNRLIAMIVGIKVEMAITLCKCIYRKRR